MPPKKQLPAPIDRPLSRAYLREFTGWSTAFPPGLSDPTSLRIMRNVQVNRDGSCRIRPGLRYLSYATPPTDDEDGITPGVALAEQCVGTHEAFYLNDGTKAYLFAVREDDGTVGFRVLVLSVAGAIVRGLTDAGVGFSVPQGEPALNFGPDTTYVKYLQIDNKIFALSNAGETIRLFFVGAEKLARKLASIERPAWEVVDKLTVVKPDAPWINTGVPIATRYNQVTNSFETSTAGTTQGSSTAVAVSSTLAKSGTKSLRISSLPERTNLFTRPLYDVATTGLTGWWASTDAASIAVSGSYMRVTAAAGSAGDTFYAGASHFDVSAGETYRLALTKANVTGCSTVRAVIRFYGSNGVQIGADNNRDFGAATGRNNSSTFNSPAGAVTASVHVYGIRSGSGTARFDVKELLFALSTESTTMFTGASGANYFWDGAVNGSKSYYHPPKDIWVGMAGGAAAPAKTYTASLQLRAGSVARQSSLKFEYFNSGGGSTGSSTEALDDDPVGSWEQRVRTLLAPAATATSRLYVDILAVPRGEYHYIDEPMVEEAGAVGTFFNGATASTSTFKRSWTGTAHLSSSKEVEYSLASTIPAAETNTANTLISSTAADNDYSFGYFYTFENEIGESAASQVTVVKTQRAWQAWKWETGNVSGEPSGTGVTDPAQAADQLVAYMPEDVYNAAKAQGAVAWNLYMLTWSDEDSVPVEGLLLESKDITAAGDYGTEGWIRHTPAMNDSGFSAALPSTANRYNYSQPSAAGQGLVAADRMILVDDPTAQAVIRWTSNLQGEYTNFTAAKGGGYKTLTSGNLFVPVAVKLWQNPQSADTLTVLCAGIDGMNTAYYMAPASVAQQSEQVTVMGFEETTASPGTTSPYGCEVMNNALYHPIDEMLMKSTASNYNISHKSQTDQIQDRWASIANKHRIVSSQHDNRLYYIVHNPKGDPVEAGCMGNEIWVYDIASEKGTWSRWKIQASSLRRIESGGKVYMSVVRPDGIFFLDPDYDRDDIVDVSTLEVGTRFIPWALETNTQGANRAHDAWSNLQQLTISLGNFQGKMRYGIRSWDLNGKDVSISKIVSDSQPLDTVDYLPFDRDDHLQVRHILKEWFLYAESVEEDGITQHSRGQINTVQYRYTPSTVNTGYEYGSVETFEYGRSVAVGNPLAPDGVPAPMLELRRP